MKKETFKYNCNDLVVVDLVDAEYDADAEVVTGTVADYVTIARIRGNPVCRSTHHDRIGESYEVKNVRSWEWRDRFKMLAYC